MPVISQDAVPRIVWRLGFCAWAFWLFSCVTVPALEPVDLKCDYAVDPLGVDALPPRLSWRVESRERDQRQSAWQVLAASDQTLHIAFGGQPLRSAQQVFWKVRVWDQDGTSSGWSPAAHWTMGLLGDAAWQAHWIGAADTNLPSLLLRHEFALRSGLKRALVFVCGLGQYELSFNGRRAGDALLAPGWSKYDKTCLYDTYDVTPLLRAGTNAAGIILGNGMYRVTGGRFVKFKGSFGPLKAIAQLHLEYADGSVEVLGSDPSWRVDPGPITFSCVYGGEDFDARRDHLGWDTPGFDDHQWQPAKLTTGPGGVLRGTSASAPHIRAMETLVPVSRRALETGVEVFDLGQNAAIIPRIDVKGPAGSVVRITPAELLHEDGSVDRVSVGRKPSYWQYTLADHEEESWFPKFHYQGCRYLQVECFPAETNGVLPEVRRLVGVVVQSASEPIGQFECSNDLFNRIHTLVRWAQRGNMVSVLTDCPHRERLGWLEQYHLNGPSLRYEFDVNRLFAKGMNDMEDSQLASGMVPSIAPEYTIFGKGPADESSAFRNSPEWGSAVILVPWQQYVFTGDTDLLERYRDSMRRYLDYLDSRATNAILDFGLGDWYDVGPNAPGLAQLTPRALPATAVYYQDARAMEQAARVLGDSTSAEALAARTDQIRRRFNAAFYDASHGVYATGSQCANAMPLALGLVRNEDRARVLEALVKDVESRGGAVTAGDVGYRYLLRALADNGRSDVIFKMISQTDRPGYGYQLKMGATSLTEAWSARRANSQNHFMLGQVMEWFYGDLAGIAPDPSQPGFQQVLIRPQPVGDITWARASYDSVRGRIVSDWSRTGSGFKLNVVVPANSTAVIQFPAKTRESVRESGQRPELQPGVRSVQFVEGHVIISAGSGQYQFTSDWSPR